ncbi:LacI family DNA-binding transcriptional regulator [Sphingobacterium sp. SYP-B4668]|uniref:LacI family DNA-binding transcriptional regulator n=1 Tax=Sphingobacterium sp. SYP-B4668 TaxID=2996035 RepID=UPI0005326375|nr:substrate-binding domain-containing protein [Sphingobacterium sp. SYP-B4668]
MKKRILISDIAKALGISVTTVSFILNDKAKEKRISDALTKRVLEYVKKVGYKPNQLAKSLRTGKTKILGLLVEDISNPFFSNIAKLIEGKAYANGYHIIYCSMDNDETKSKELIQMFYDRQIDGFIITPSEGLEETITQLLQNNVPLILFDRYLSNVETNYVVTDNLKGAYDATDHLIDQGFKRVGLVSLYSSQTQMRDRLEGYMKAVDKHKKQAFIKKVQQDAAEAERIKEIDEFVEENRLDAVVFATNYLAIDGLKAVKLNKRNLPAIVAFDDHTLFKLYEPSITVVSQPIAEIADELITALLAQIQGKNKRLRQIVLPCDLKVRESSLQTVNQYEG